MKKIFTLLFLSISISAFSQVSITTLDTDFTQNFDGLVSSGSGTWSDNTTLTGWYAKTDNTASITACGANAGGTTTGALYSFGTASASDRALGYAASNAFTGTSPAKGYIGFRLKNNTGLSILNITLTYTGEQWRKEANATAQTLTVEYQTGTTVTNLTGGTWTSAGTGLTFTSPIASGTAATTLDGNNSLNRIANISLSFDLASALADGDEIMIRWVDPNDSGTDHMLAIDDVKVQASSVLPIKLLSFNAKKLQNTVQLNWSTASEINNSHFNIERSIDGKEFVSIARVEGAGNSNRILNYSVTDEKPFNGTNYYRLRQTDFDGTSTVSTIVAVNSDKKNFEILHAQSEGHSLNMDIYSPAASSTTIAIIDLSGRTVAEETINLTEGFNSVSLSTQNIVTGIHFIRISGAENTVSKKFVF